MGGHALKTVKTRRYEREEFEALSKGVLEKFKTVLGNRPLSVVPYYRSKETFGDLDILCPENQVADYRALIQQTFSPQELTVNDNVYSFDVEDLQVDFIVKPPEVYWCALDYFSFNDLGNFMGKVAHALGLKYGFDGLTVPIRVANTHEIGTVTLSRDSCRIFQFLGYDYNRFREGFNDLEDVFEYAISTPYFDHESYLDEALNHTNRIRDRKRNSYMAFRAWMVANGAISKYYACKDKTVYHPMIDAAFPEADFVRTRAKMMADAARHQAARARVIEAVRGNAPGDRIFGAQMAAMRKDKGQGHSFYSWVEVSSDAEIRAYFDSLLATLQPSTT